MEPPPEGVSLELAYTNKDTDEPPVASGIRFTGPLNEFVPAMALTGNFAFKATSKNRLTQETDRAPDIGVLTIKYPPNPIPGDLNLDNKVDASDLEIMTWDWPQIGTSRADIFPPIGDVKVDFLDYAILANNWLIDFKTTNPQPPDEAIGVPLFLAQVSWTPFGYATAQTVYFSKNFADIYNGVGGVPLPGTASSYGGFTKPLDLQTTYYWRVDTIIGTTTYKGNIWRFTTAF